MGRMLGSIGSDREGAIGSRKRRNEQMMATVDLHDVDWSAVAAFAALAISVVSIWLNCRGVGRDRRLQAAQTRTELLVALLQSHDTYREWGQPLKDKIASAEEVFAA